MPDAMADYMSKATVAVEHFSDVLCVWAYITQIRVDELRDNFADEVQVNYRFLQVFGDVAGKMATQWADRDGLDGYAAHVQEVVAQFPHISISPQAWLVNTPKSSLPAHLLLCGARVMGAASDNENTNLVERLLQALRHAFFVDIVDISDQQALFEVAGQTDIDVVELKRVVGSGEAHACLAADLAAAAQSGVRASPTIIFNEGRQILAGNVGYRVLEANIRELLRSPDEQVSWC
jgi:predicted DsbA family dithiol-disulfide isomerase